MNAWFVSDIHLKTLNERNGILLLRFLSSLKRSGGDDYLFLLGDIFDLWFGDHDFYYKKFFPIVEAIMALKNQGWQVHYFEGNHDLHVREFWQRHEIPCYDGVEYIELGSQVVRIEHGDFINPDDVAYQRLRKFMRSSPIETFAQVVPAAGLSVVGEALSKISRKRSSVVRQSKEEELRMMIRAYAENSYKQKPFDLLVAGHMHVRDDYSFERDKKTVRSINLGSWFDHPCALHIDEQGVHWVEI